MTTDTPPHSCRVLDLEITDDGTAMVCPHGYRVGIPGPAVIDGQPVHLGAPEPTHLTPDTAPPTEYVPSIEGLRDAVAARTTTQAEYDRTVAIFNRAIAAHDREVAARALREAADALVEFAGETYPTDVFLKPSRADYDAINALLNRERGHQLDGVAADCYRRALALAGRLLRERADEAGETDA